MEQIVIIGVGAMGCFFGAHLHPLASVTLLGHWRQQIQAIQQHGLHLEYADGRSGHVHLPITDDPTAIPPANLALILVKSHQTQTAARLAAQALAGHGLALTLQNGLGNRETLTAALGESRAALGITSAGAAVPGPGRVRIAGMGQTHLARQPETPFPLEEVAALFRQAGFPTTLTDNGHSLAWGKLAVNAGINPLTALLQVPNGYLAENEAARAIMLAAARETAAVARAAGIPLPYADAGERALAVARNTASNHSSMWQDLQRGAPTEIEAICGAIVAYGRGVGVPTPVNRVLLRAIRQREQAPAAPLPDPPAQIVTLQTQIQQQESA